MKIIEKTYIRLFLLACFWLTKLPLWAQDDDDDEELYFGIRNVPLYDVEDYSFLNISYFDIFLIILVLVACILLGRVRKELVYIFLCLAALAYYFSKQ
jgi:hypothetical protein